MDMSVNLGLATDLGLYLSSPVMIASGTLGSDGYMKGITADMPLHRLGAIVPKTLTRHRREGNPEPWLFSHQRDDWKCGDEHTILNSNGLHNPGIEYGLSKMAPKWAQLDTHVVLSMAAHDEDVWGEMAGLTRGVEGIAAIELNLSCPNVDKGAYFSHHADQTASAVRNVREEIDLPIWAKLSPNVPDITEIACAAVEAGANALTISNTMPGMHIDTDTGRAVLGVGYGGLSGPALRPIAMALVHKAAQAVSVPIIGVGGIMTGQHAAEFLMAGATAVQVGSANLADLYAPFRILSELEDLLTRWEVDSVEQIVGTAWWG
jgi:dihydroorotate dehydrogenase (NAD+) catalytic subunit